MDQRLARRADDVGSTRQPLRALTESSTVPRFVPTHDSVAEALSALEAAPPRRIREVPLPDEITCGSWIRRMVEQTCQEWGVPDIAFDATLVASELTENVIRHAGSDGWLRLELRTGESRGAVLTIAVADADPRPPRLCPATERQNGGRGLVLVAELSRAWGYLPQAQGGKVVWSVLAIPGPMPTSGVPGSSRR